MTLRDKLLTVAAGLGLAKPEKTRSSKYEVFIRPKGGYYFIGRHGSLRYGRTVRDSFSLDAKKWVEENGKPEFFKTKEKPASAGVEEEYI